MWNFGRGSALLHPTRLLERAGVRPGWQVADLGCGHIGHFVFPASHLVGPQGNVHAVDVQRSAVQSIENQARVGQRWNVKPLWADLEHPNGIDLPSDAMDLTLLINVLYLANDRSRMLREAFRITKPGRYLLIIEWSEGRDALGPPFEQRIASNEVLSHLAAHPVAWADPFEAGEHHHAVLVQKDETSAPAVESVSLPIITV